MGPRRGNGLAQGRRPALEVWSVLRGLWHSRDNERTVMRLQLLSDLHFEFHRDGGRSFVASLEPELTDVLVLAGDIAVGEGIGPALELFSARYSHAQVVYVHGNHEFYGSCRATVLAQTRNAVAALGNVHFLDAECVEIGGVRILGTPLWFPHDPRCELFRSAMADFSQIHDYAAWVYEENTRAIRYLERELRAGDIVVTHHLPVRAAISPRFTNNPLNVFFLSDMEALLRARQPRYWLHGHTHDSVRVRVGLTEVVCNPFGYAPADLNRVFDERLVLDTDSR
jgi:predicted phosphodiesterase